VSENAPRRVLEPSARGPVEGRFHDWRGLGHDAEIETARAESRRLVGEAIASGASDDWARAEGAVHRCLSLALARAGNQPAQRLVNQVLTAPDTRSRYVFLEDLLHGIGK